VQNAYKEDKWGDRVTCQLLVETRVPHGRLWISKLRGWSWRLSTDRSRCQGTADEDIAGWKIA
jgi:hypothetical protein